jgi:hypothetical protein
MKVSRIILGICFIAIWFLISIFLGAVTRIEKKETKDGSWKIFLAVFMFSVLNAIAYGVLTLAP